MSWFLYQPQYKRDFGATFDDMLISVTRFLLIINTDLLWVNESALHFWQIIFFVCCGVATCLSFHICRCCKALIDHLLEFFILRFSLGGRRYKYIYMFLYKGMASQN